MTDPIALACAAPDRASWILAGFGLATVIEVVIALVVRRVPR